ncbi:ProQ/FINO family protein [Azohydromonas lata]|uniref:ProQ/FINO family protein n=1 Tax=Azohydromonas lata TaxID=45677 RepID=A0ABU5I8B8_9BURK|nr:ProQ/FINO family protein [Azohydromonas lata]MDZ5455337.1 ProQ/FINO family protein [Azohydromonas lata]
MTTEPVIHRKQRRVVVVASEQPPAAPAPAIAEAKPDRPVLKLKARSTPPAAAPAPAGKAPTEAATAASPRQEPLSNAERKRRQAAKADAALRVLAGHFPGLFTSVRPMAIGTGKVLDAERKAGRLPLGCIPLKLALSAWTASDAYLEALAASGARINLAGEAEGEVTPEQAARAARKLHKRRDAAAKRHDA